MVTIREATSLCVVRCRNPICLLMFSAPASHLPQAVLCVRPLCPCFLRSQALNHKVPHGVRRASQPCAKIKGCVTQHLQQQIMQRPMQGLQAVERPFDLSRPQHAHARQQRSVSATATSQSSAVIPHEPSNSPSTTYVAVRHGATFRINKQLLDPHPVYCCCS